MPEDLPESLFAILRADIAGLNARLDRLVSTDVFAAEQRRRDDQYVELNKDIQDEKTARAEAIAAEKLAREAAIRHEREAREKAHEQTDKRSKSAWSVARWSIGTMIAIAGVVAAFWVLVVK